MPLNNAMERPTRCAERVDATGHLWIFNEWWRVVRFNPRVDNERTGTAPMLLPNEFTNSVNVCCRVGTRERDPKEVAERLRSKRSIIDRYDQREFIAYSTSIR